MCPSQTIEVNQANILTRDDPNQQLANRYRATLPLLCKFRSARCARSSPSEELGHVARMLPTGPQRKTCVHLSAGQSGFLDWGGFLLPALVNS